LNSAGKVVMESVLETKAVTVLQFIRGLRGNLLVTLEEGTQLIQFFESRGYHRCSHCDRGALSDGPYDRYAACGKPTRRSSRRFGRGSTALKMPLVTT
jgi:hypothetical protein